MRTERMLFINHVLFLRQCSRLCANIAVLFLFIPGVEGAILRVSSAFHLAGSPPCAARPMPVSSPQKRLFAVPSLVLDHSHSETLSILLVVFVQGESKAPDETNSITNFLTIMIPKNRSPTENYTTKLQNYKLICSLPRLLCGKNIGTP